MPAFRVACLVVFGALIDAQVPAARATERFLLSGVLALTALMILVWKSGRCAAWILSLVASLLCIVLGSAKYSLDKARMPVEDPAWRGRDVLLDGFISDEPQHQGTRTRLLLEARNIGDAGVRKPFHTTVLVTVLGGRRDMPVPVLRYGQWLLLRGRIDRPPAERNPGEFSARTYYEANGTTHFMTVRHGGADVHVLDSLHGSWWMANAVLPARRFILHTFDVTTGGEEGEFLKGLVVGERGGLTQETKDAFVNAGVAHVLAVSGSNVAVVVGVLILVLQLVRIPPRGRTLVVIAGILAYMFITGSQPPVVRATIMAVVLLLGKLIQRPTRAFNAIGVAAIIIVMIDARQVLDVGFQLSFGAVLSIMLLYPVMSRWIRGIQGPGQALSALRALLHICAVSLAATLGTLPITAASFGKVSVIGVLANIIVIPATEFAVMLGAATLAAAGIHATIAAAYGTLNYHVLHWTLVLTRLAGFSSLAYIDTVRFGTWDAVPYFLALSALYYAFPRHRFPGIVALLLAGNILVWTPRTASGATGKAVLRVTFLDVGQGDAALIECPGGPVFLMDAGPKSATFDAGERVVVPFLQRRGIDSLDFVAISHPHADHAGGLAAVIGRIHVARVLAISPCALRAGVREFSHTEIVCRCDSVVAGSVLVATKNLRVVVVYPADPLAKNDPAGNMSLILKVQFGKVSFLLTGDAERAEEHEAVMVFGDALQSTVVKAGHHGSNTSNTQEMLDRVQPRMVVISVGKNNRFNHPSSSVLERFDAMGITIARTDEDGAVICETDGSSLTRLEWR